MRRCLPAVALLAAIVACLPRAAQAGLWSADTVAAYGLEAEFAQLRAARERLVRHQALHRDLRRVVEELDRDIVALRRRGDQVRAELASRGDAVRAQERALDRVVPRLVARERMMAQRRGQAARALADLAGLSRRQELDTELRARLRAVGPALLALVRKGDAASAALAGEHDRLAEQRQRLAARMPILRAELERLEDERETLRGRRRGALQRLAGLDAELRGLARADLALARRLLAVEAAHRARAEPAAAHPARQRAGMVVAAAPLRGQAAPAGSVTPASRTRTARAEMVAVTRAPKTWPGRLAPALAVRQPLPRGAHGRAGPRDRVVATVRTDEPGGPLAPVPVAMAAASLSSRVVPAGLEPPAPLRPSRAVATRPAIDGLATDITIAALPGQRVAAPQDGRVVFAGAFKDYGLLLIIEHASEYHTLLWGFSKLRVMVGDEVRGGEIVGVMDVIDGLPPRLGVEFRRRGRPVDPLPWLAGSSNKVRG